MKEPVFIDSSFWIALLDQKDQKHPIARDHLKSLLQNYRICLSDFIVFETITYLNCSIKRHDLALTFLKKTESPGILLIIVDEIVKSKSVEWFKRYSGKDLSITDCTSFVLMKSHKIQLYAGFDRHFEEFGFSEIFSHMHSD
jgi:predicted nucleic acid-binding protein